MNIGEPKYTKQILIHIKVETDNDKIIVGGFSTPLISMYKSFTEKSNKEIVALKDTLDQIDLIDSHRTFHQDQQNTYSFQVHMKLCPRYITC